MIWGIYVTNIGGGYFTGVSFSTDGTYVVAQSDNSNRFIVLLASDATVIMSTSYSPGGSYSQYQRTIVINTSGAGLLAIG